MVPGHLSICYTRRVRIYNANYCPWLDSPCGPMDKASAFEAEDSGFEPRHGFFFLFSWYDSSFRARCTKRTFISSSTRSAFRFPFDGGMIDTQVTDCGLSLCDEDEGGSRSSAVYTSQQAMYDTMRYANWFYNTYKAVSYTHLTLPTKA